MAVLRGHLTYAQQDIEQIKSSAREAAIITERTLSEAVQLATLLEQVFQKLTWLRLFSLHAMAALAGCLFLGRSSIMLKSSRLVSFVLGFYGKLWLSQSKIC